MRQFENRTKQKEYIYIYIFFFLNWRGFSGVVVWVPIDPLFVFLSFLQLYTLFDLNPRGGFVFIDPLHRKKEVDIDLNG